MDSRTKISPSELGVQIFQNCLVELLSRFPQLDAAFAALPCVPDEAVPTVGVDGAALRFSPRWILPLYRDGPARLRRGYLHMLLHCLYLHPFAGNSGRLWNLAADIAVEQTLSAALPAPPDRVRDGCLQILGGEARSAEALYEMLRESAFPFSTAEMEAAFSFDSHALWRPGPEERQKWRALASGAGRGGGRTGHTAGDGAETVGAGGPGRYDYRRFLRQFTTRREEVIPDPENFDLVLYSFGMDLYGNLPLIEPLEYQEAARLAELVIAIDTSGSCSAETVRRFLEETYAIVSAQENFFREMKVYLIQCDCLVQSVTVIRSAQEWLDSCRRITIQGRGGTDFTPVFRYVEELRRNKELNDLKALLYFTDGDGVYPRQPTEYQTAFVFLHKNNHMDHVPPWAVTLALEEPAGCTNDSGQVRGQTI